jgi:NAD-reducing hydrogenase large subunit
VRRVAEDYLEGAQITEPLLNLVEVAIRAYDPCLSCATHAIGQMPLKVKLIDVKGDVIDEKVRD